MGRKKKRESRRQQQPRPAAPPEPPAAQSEPPAPRRGLTISLAGLSVVLLLVVLMIFNLEEVYELENKAQDVLAGMRKEPASGEVVVVMIDDEDYKQLFGATSPLKPETLKTLIEGITACGPTALGVDVATDDARFRPLKGVGAGTPVVWASAVYEFVDNPEGGPRMPSPAGALGGGEDGAMPTLLDDEGGVTRYYQRSVETTLGVRPSFAQAVVEKARPLSAPRATTERRVIRYARWRDDESEDDEAALNRWRTERASTFVPPGVVWPEGRPVCLKKGVLEDKVALLGGNYLGGEKHETPLGLMSGVLIWANVVETELSRGGGVVLPSEWTLVPLWLLQGVLLVLVFQRFPLDEAPLKNLGLSIALVLVSSLVGSVLAAGSLNALHHVAYFLPVGLAALLFHVADAANDWRKKRIAKALGQPGRGG